MRRAGSEATRDVQAISEVCADCRTLPTTKQTAPYCAACYELLATLQSDDELRHTRLSAVYSELSRIHDVETALAQLYTRVCDGLERLPPGGSAEPTTTESRAVEDFVDRWRLPPARGAADVWYSLRFTAAARADLARMDPHLREVAARFGELVLRAQLPTQTRVYERVTGAMLEPVNVAPSTRAAFEVDPTTMSHVEVKRRLAELEITGDDARSILRGDLDLRRTAQHGGWSRLHPRYLAPGEIARQARRVAGRMAGRSWASILSHDAKADAKLTLRAVRSSVERWAVDLELPREVYADQARRPGRAAKSA